ncbi:MAG TPA: aminotransferase class I/II-fold pyridoxal phosphate-dependent enzyme [Rhizomicrobium sp.]
MKIETFLLERNQSLYENSVRYNLTESGVHPYALKDVLTPDEREEILGLPLGYGHTNGDPALRRAIANLYPGLGEDNVLVTNGSAEANFAAIWSVVEPGDEVVAMLPNYMLAWGALKAFGAAVKPFHLREELNWAPDLDELRAAMTAKTKMIVVCNPNNPTGAVLDRATMEAIANLACEHGAYVLSDEIYRGSEFDGVECPSFAAVYDKAIVCSGLSKAMALPGLRIGWIAGPRDIVAAAWHRHDYTTICTSIPSQYAAGKVLEPARRRKILDHGRALLRRNLAVFGRWLGDYDTQFRFVAPKAGGMAFVRYALDMNSSALVDRLRRDKSVFVVAGDWFGMDRHLRFGIGTETETLAAGLKLTSEALAEIAS